jgi:tetratricopeptide (TPR) repeat protein
MNSTVQHKNAIQQSNAGASLIAAGEYNTAIEELLFALKAYKQGVVMSEADKIPEPVETSLDQCMAQSLAVSGHRKACLVDDNDQYMYKQAIHIPLDIESTSQSSAMIPSLILFNSALAHHLSAMASGNRQSPKLLRAAKLYELAFILQRDAQLDNNVLFTLAALNNLGVVHHQLENKETATKCFQQVLSTIMLLVDCGEAEVCGHLDGFLHNVVFETCSAPAA